MWYYDEYAKRWYIDYGLERDDEDNRESYCGRCEDVKQIGIDACIGCCGK